MADHYQAKFIGIGSGFVATYETEKAIADADIVFGMGRSVMEGVAMGKIGVVHGRWGTGGVINKNSYERLKLTNFSGRLVEGQNKLLLASEIIKQIDESFNTKITNENRELIETNHNVEIATKKFLEIAEKL